MRVTALMVHGQGRQVKNKLCCISTDEEEQPFCLPRPSVAFEGGGSAVVCTHRWVGVV